MKNNSQEIYVHIPFCERKCAYCDFVSFVSDREIQGAYFEKLKSQIKIKAESAGTLPADSVFFGGGTPSAVDSGLIYETLEELRKSFVVTEDAEITLEANPNSLTREKLKVYREAGINRLSIGLQSSDNEELKVLSRLHTWEQFLEAFETAREEGFQNINIDIMSALPGQSLESYGKTLNRVLELNPEHISAYSLIIEENTPFYERYKNGEGLPPEDTEREMYYETKRLLATKGFERYEISNYARPGKECRHNIGYWTRKPYLGFGIAAASLTDEKRYMMHTDLKRFISGDFKEETEVLSEKDRLEEFMFLGLRLTRGVSKAEFRAEFGRDIYDVYGNKILKLKEEGLLCETDRLFLSERGLDLANVCMAEFMLD